jgi:hypothetical protein
VEEKVDDYEEELDRWRRRAEVQRRRLRAGSEEERHLSRAIRGMEVAQLGRRRQRAQRELGSLRSGSDEERELSDALQEMEDEYIAGLREIQAQRPEHRSPAWSEAGARPAEARRALERASSSLRDPASDAALLEAIAQIEHALALLGEELRER